MEKGNEVKTVVPGLRFPEFQDMGGWKEFSMDKLFDFKQGFQCPIEEQYEKQENGMVRFIRIIDLTQPYTPFRFINDPGNHYHVNKEDLFMVRYGDPGLIGFGYEGVIANNLFQLIPKTDLKSYFFYFLLSREKQRINELSSSTSLSAINFASLNTFKINVPPNEYEQQKIADCLSSLDDLIEATAQKVEALKEHKKGLMQRLFPVEGKNVPNLRFSEFQGAKEWKECSLDEYFDFKQGFQCPIEEQYDKQENGMVRFIRIIDLTQPSTPYRYINDPGNQYYINKENLFMVRYGDPGLIGIGYEGIIANNLFQLIPKKKSNPYFFYFLFSKEKTRIKGLSSSTSLSAINFASLKALKIVVSQNIDEQQKIADCLFSLDELIEAISRKVEILKEHKKGLMQQLFPKI